MAEEKKEKTKVETKTEKKEKTKVETKTEKKEKTKVETKTEKKETTKSTSTPAVKKTSKKSEKKEKKIELTREYVIPLKRKVLNVPRYRRAKKAVKVIREFIVRHMRVEDRDERKVKIDKYLNNELWFRGIKKPANKIKVKAIKKDGIVYVELAELPEAVKFAKTWEEKRSKAAEKAKVKTPKHEEKKEEETPEEKKEEEEKEKASVEAGLKRQADAAKKAKHTTTGAHQKKVAPQRKALKK